MVVIELYSQRRLREQGQADDVFQYNVIPKKLRNQACAIIQECFGDPTDLRNDRFYETIARLIRKEMGVIKLSNEGWAGLEIFSAIRNGDETLSLDIIDVMFRLIYGFSDSWQRNSEIRADPAVAIDEINHRFRQNGVGFTYENGVLTRIDSQILHETVVRPALLLLSDPIFANAEREFRSAHEYWKNSQHGPVLVECLKAFESTMKIIAHEKGWEIPAKVSASSLIDMCLVNNLIPQWYKAHMTGLRGVLEGGIPTPRNKVGGHGAGPAPVEDVPEALVRYVLHMTAATVLFLVDSYKELP